MRLLPPSSLSGSAQKDTSPHTNLHQDRYPSDGGVMVDWDDPTNPVRGERAVWQAVIMQALTDASSNSQKSEAKQHKLQALEWLLGGSEDFLEVCDYADMDSGYVQQKVKEALARGCRWRAAPGEKSATVTRLPTPYTSPISRKSVDITPSCSISYFPISATQQEALHL